MTIVGSASAPAPAVAPVVAHVHALANGGHGFSATLDTLAAGEGKAKSTEQDDKRTADDSAAAASARPSADLRAALMGGALASLSTPSRAVADAASPAGGAHPTASSLLRDSGSDAPAPAIGETGGAAAGAKSVPGATVTAERAYVAPAAFANALGGPGKAAQAASAQAEALAPAISTAPPGRPGPATAQIASSAPLGAPTVATAATARAVSPTLAAAAAGASAVEPRPATGTVLPRSTRPFVRATAAAHAAGTGSAAHAPSGASTVEAKRDASEAGGPGGARGQGASAPLQGAASANPFCAASSLAVPAQGGAALSTSSDSSAAPAARTSAPAAAASTAQRVHEIDLDLAPGGVADASMTVRLAGDKLGVVIRAASGETAATIEAARDAIAERLAAIGQPVSSIIIQQTDRSDATGGSGQSTAEGEGRAQQGQNGDSDDARGSRRGASRN